MKEVDGAGFWHIVELRASGLDLQEVSPVREPRGSGWHCLVRKSHFLAIWMGDSEWPVTGQMSQTGSDLIIHTRIWEEEPSFPHRLNC